VDANSRAGVGATLVVDQNLVDPNERAGTSPAPTNINVGLGNVIGMFKSITTHDYILAVRRGDLPPFEGKIWQRNYYEHIIRNEMEWEWIAQYIYNNPICWAEDAENPSSNQSITAEPDNIFRKS
jgi:putative transposase